MLIIPHEYSKSIHPSHGGTKREKESAHARVGYGKSSCGLRQIREP